MPARRPWLVGLVIGLAACAGVALWCTRPGPRVTPAPAPTGTPADSAATSMDSSLGPDARGAADAAPAARAEDEDRLMTRLRQVVDRQPRRALALVREAERRFPRSRLGDERALLRMRALVHLGQIAPARDEAVLFFKRFPGSPLAPRVQQLTGTHPRPRPGPRRGP